MDNSKLYVQFLIVHDKTQINLLKFKSSKVWNIFASNIPGNIVLAKVIQGINSFVKAQTIESMEYFRRVSFQVNTFLDTAIIGTNSFVQGQVIESMECFRKVSFRAKIVFGYFS